MPRQLLKTATIIAHDLVATALAVILTFVIRFDGPMLAERIGHLPLLLPPFVALAALVYRHFGLYRSKWRFASLPDLADIVRAVSVLCLVLLVVDYLLVSPVAFGIYFFGKIAIGLYFVLQIFLLGGPRLAFRYLKYSRTRQNLARSPATPTLLLGRGGDIEVVLRAVESGTVRKLAPLGILSPRPEEQGQTLRGVRVFGGFSDLERIVADFAAARGIAVRRLVATPSALAPEARPDDLIARARRLGLPLARVASLGEACATPSWRRWRSRTCCCADRRHRPPRLEHFLRGRRVVVTGGGGSIGSEICARAVAFGAASVLVLENSEPALHGVLSQPPWPRARPR